MKNDPWYGGLSKGRKWKRIGRENKKRKEGRKEVGKKKEKIEMKMMT